VDLRSTFHQDKVQELISKYASQAFEVAVHVIEREGHEYPVIAVAGGGRTPVATKAAVVGTDNKPLLLENRVFVRSLNSNGRPSSTEATWKDWPEIVERCLDNREADIGRFLRRHLGSSSLEPIRTLLQEMLLTNDRQSPSLSTGPSAEPSTPPSAAGNGESDVDARCRVLLDGGRARLNALLAERSVPFPRFGSLEVCATILATSLPSLSLAEFRNRVLASNLDLTGWPPWVDSRNFADAPSRPYVFEKGWESLTNEPGGGWGSHFDFYLFRILQDDLQGSDRSPKPLSELDFGLAILRPAEVIAVALAFARSLGATDEHDAIALCFRWAGLKGRRLTSWAQPMRYLSMNRVAYSNEVSSSVVVPVSTQNSELAVYVRDVVRPLFEVFDGYEVNQKVVEDLTQRLVTRRL
jgi:hypothetical protein